MLMYAGVAVARGREETTSTGSFTERRGGQGEGGFGEWGSVFG